jgi:hypothetical protein
MAIDELHFHRRRGLGAWERIGHPLDTLTFLACLVWVFLVRPTRAAVGGYVALAAVSCLFITKDEFVHAHRCSAGEHWLHALLFVLHPIALASVAVLWPGLHASASAVPGWLEATVPVSPLLAVQLGITAAFFVYQTTYWNLRWQLRARLRG